MFARGVFDPLGAAALLSRPTGRVGRADLSALTIDVARVRVHMLQRPDVFDVPYRMRALQLPLPIAPLALIGPSAAAPDARGTARNT